MLEISVYFFSTSNSQLCMYFCLPNWQNTAIYRLRQNTQSLILTQRTEQEQEYVQPSMVLHLPKLLGTLRSLLVREDPNRHVV